MSDELTLLLLTAAGIGVVHTLLGPDHYLPFIALARARGWRLSRTLSTTALCGAGHVAGSLALAAAALALGWSLSLQERLERVRGEVAAWLLVGLGIAYLAWGLRQALRGRRHSHWHAHADGTVHRHEHHHRREHAHTHAGQGLAGWALFLIFVFGPCEPLVPLVLYPAAVGSAAGTVLVAAVFAATTVGTMVAAVAAGTVGLGLVPAGPLARFGHAIAGAAVAACGLVIL